jgi:hypothetical protein
MSWQYTRDREPDTGARVRVHSSETWAIGTAVYKGDGQWERVTPLPFSESLGEIDAWEPLPLSWLQTWLRPFKRPVRAPLSPIRQSARS